MNREDGRGQILSLYRNRESRLAVRNSREVPKSNPRKHLLYTLWLVLHGPIHSPCKEPGEQRESRASLLPRRIGGFAEEVPTCNETGWHRRSLFSSMALVLFAIPALHAQVLSPIPGFLQDIAGQFPLPGEFILE